MAGFPLPKYHFQVSIPGAGDLDFQEVTGLTVENEFTEYRAGNNQEFIPERRVSIRKGGTVSFKKGMIKGDKGLINVYDNVTKKSKFFSSHSSSVNITVNLLDEGGGIAFTWVIKNAVPIKLATDNLNATENGIAIETIDFSHSGIELK